MGVSFAAPTSLDSPELAALAEQCRGCRRSALGRCSCGLLGGGCGEEGVKLSLHAIDRRG